MSWVLRRGGTRRGSDANNSMSRPRPSRGTDRISPGTSWRCPGAVLTANHGTVGVNVTGKSKVIFAGNPTKQDIKDVKVFANAGSGAVISNADDVSVQISPLYNEAKLTADGGITDITVNRGFINTALYNASLPVKNMVAEVADTALTGDGVGSDFIIRKTT